MEKILELLKALNVDLTEENQEKIKTIFSDYVSKADFNAKEQELLAKNGAFDLLKNQLEQEKAKKQSSSEDNLTAQKIQELEEQIKTMKIEKNRAKLENLFIQKGIKDEMYNAFLDKLPLENEELATEIVNNTFSMLDMSVENTKQSFVSQNQLPKGVVGNGKQKMTKEEFSKLGTVARVELLQSNPTLYNELVEQELN